MGVDEINSNRSVESAFYSFMTLRHFDKYANETFNGIAIGVNDKAL